jgi:HTH-type transcriptional regulator / antitoxin HigA
MNTPIRTKAEYDSAVAEVNRLWGSDPGTPEGDRLDLLLILVAAYEEEHDAIDPPDPIDAIIERMDNLGMTRADLGTMLGATSGRVSEILNRRRPLSIEMIRKLARGLGLSERCLLIDTAARAKPPSKVILQSKFPETAKAKSGFISSSKGGIKLQFTSNKLRSGLPRKKSAAPSLRKKA